VLRVRITRRLHGTIDGFELSRFMEGFTYEVGTHLANVLLAEGWAVPVADHERDEPALVVPLSARPRVLVVEDDDDARAVLRETLQHHGYSVIEARDGREGLTALRRHRPALILLDLRMPRMDGFQFRRMQQDMADPALANVPVVIVSAFDDARDQAQSLGVKEVMAKPIDLPRLLRTVDSQIRH
jgi:CheY-like chemotaxis protein